MFSILTVRMKHDQPIDRYVPLGLLIVVTKGNVYSVPILEDSGDGFVKILLPDGTEGWVNRTDVQMGGVEVEAICARFRIYSARSDYGEAQLRGVSRDCD